MQKTCSRCKAEKPLDAFGPDKSMTLGRRSRCRQCMTEVQKQRYEARSMDERRRIWREADNRPRLYNSHKNRTAAIAAGELFYEGKPCNKCGTTKRYVSISTCASCVGDKSRFKNAQPKWLTQDQIREIAAIYRDRPKGHEIDHLIPINGKNVCGLHVPWNLRAVPKWINRLKRNLNLAGTGMLESDPWTD